MDITGFLDSFRADLRAAAETGSEPTQQAAERLLAAVAPAAHLMLLEAFSQAAAEITADLEGGHVEVCLRGRDPEFVVTAPPVAQPATPPVGPDLDDEADAGDEAISRITLRLPESLKAKAEEAAGRAGVSLNAWLVSTARSAVHSASSVNIDIDLTSLPFFERPGARPGKRMSGWV